MKNDLNATEKVSLKVTLLFTVGIHRKAIKKMKSITKVFIINLSVTPL